VIWQCACGSVMQQCACVSVVWQYAAQYAGVSMGHGRGSEEVIL